MVAETPGFFKLAKPLRKASDRTLDLKRSKSQKKDLDV